MQKKTILITVAVLVAGVCAFFFVRNKYFAKPEKTEVITFLERFNADIVKGNTDSLLNYFGGKHKNRQLGRLLNLLSNRTSSVCKAALFDVGLIPDYSDVKAVNAELVQVKLPVLFNEKGNTTNPKQTFLWLSLRKISPGKFRITKIDSKDFLNDFIAYESKFNTSDPDAKVVYDPTTLAAFKTAEQLKSRYDSVAMFTHLNGKTWFYVGKLKAVGEKSDDPGRGGFPIFLGLLNPNLKEIIPPEYDKVYGINGTFNELIEVEKGGKRGYYTIDGKLKLPVDYDQIFPINDPDNMAVLRKGDNYYYWKKDTTVYEKVDLKASDFITKIKLVGTSYSFDIKSAQGITEYNSHENHQAVFFFPS